MYIRTTASLSHDFIKWYLNIKKINKFVFNDFHGLLRFQPRVSPIVWNQSKTIQLKPQSK